MKMKVWVTISLLAVCYTVSGQRAAYVQFNTRGINGRITFTEAPASSVRIVAELDGLRGNHNWHVHTLPVDQSVDPAYQCLSVSAGPHYDPFNANNGTTEQYQARCTTNTPEMCEVGDLAGKFGAIPLDGRINVTDMTGLLSLQGRYSIIGRSVVIHRHDDGTNFVCGTIRLMEEQQAETGVTSLQATFISPISGTIYFRQVGSGSNTAIWGKMYWVDDTDTTMEHNWHIHMTAPGEEYRTGYCNTSVNIGGHYDPTNNGPTSDPGYSSQCTPDTQRGCEVGDLTGKHNTLVVSAIPAPYATNSFFYTDSFLNLTDVVNRSVAIHMPNRGGPVVACAPLVESEEIVLFNYENGMANQDLKVSQISPFEDTIITTINFPSQVSVLNSALNPQTNCEELGGVYDPYPPIVAESPGVSTPDRYSLGSWQERYNSLLAASGRLSVFDVPIHGSNNTISLRSVRYSSGANRMCNALLPSLTGNVILAKASFNGPINGAIYFVQEDFGFDQLGNTHIAVDIYYADTNLRDQESFIKVLTEGHNWHVHENRTQPGLACGNSIGDHYNPFMVSLDNTDDAMSPSQFSNYRDDCSPQYSLRCESGDLSGKHGRLSISSDGPSRRMFTYVDSNLALTGMFSVVGRSIGLHNFTGPLFDCGDIQRVYISSSVVSVRLDADTQLRTEIVRMLTTNVDVDPTDVLVLSQDISPLAFGFNCVDVTARVLGSTQSEADRNADLLNGQTGMFTCNGSPVTVAPLSILLLVVCLLLGLSF